MKLTIKQSDIDAVYPLFLRSAGYTYIQSRQTGQESFMRPLGNGGYPRFHIYVNEAADSLTFNIHLDQKKAVYEGVTAHSGEYDGEIVIAEVDRLKNLIRSTPSTPHRKTNSAPIDGQDERSRRWSNMLRNM